MHKRTELLIIDPQNDFCDLPTTWYGVDPLSQQPVAPSLPVAGAHADMLRLATFVARVQDQLDAITVTLDSHHRVDIAHPAFWRRGDGGAVTPFTAITAQQVRAGEVQLRLACALPRTLAYLDALEAQGCYTLMVWPVHCEIGTWGHGIHAAVRTACAAWEEAQQRTVRHVFKGMNPWTEHYSAIQAEVPDAADPETQFNLSLVNALDRADLLLIAGEASSHCVKATTEHVIDQLPRGDLQRVVLLTDCMSPVAGFEGQAKDFLARMQSRGVRLATNDDILK